MNTLRAYFSVAYWEHGFSWQKAIAAVLSSFGALWLLLEIVSFFSGQASVTIKEYWWLFLISGLIAAFWLNRPIHEVSCHLTGRDVLLRICVGNLLKIDGAKVIASNTTFDTDTASGLISPKSLQGQFTSANYSSVSHLDHDLSAALSGRDSVPSPAAKLGKANVYPIGTVASVAPKGNTAYFVAIAPLNSNGVATGTFEDLKVALPFLWEHITNAGSIDPLVVPVLGSGFARLPEKREEIVREILKSFVAACASRRFTNSLTIVIHPKDFYQYSVDLGELGAYLRHTCKYSEYGVGTRVGLGTAAG